MRRQLARRRDSDPNDALRIPSGRLWTARTALRCSSRSSSFLSWGRSTTSFRLGRAPSERAPIITQSAAHRTGSRCGVDGWKGRDQTRHQLDTPHAIGVRTSLHSCRLRPRTISGSCAASSVPLTPARLEAYLASETILCIKKAKIEKIFRMCCEERTYWTVHRR